MICCTAISFFPVCVCCYVFSLPQMCSMAELFATFWTHVWLLSSVRLNVSPQNTLQLNVFIALCTYFAFLCEFTHYWFSYNYFRKCESVKVWKCESVRMWKCESLGVWNYQSVWVCESESLKVWWPLFLLVGLKKSCTDCTSEACPLCVT